MKTSGEDLMHEKKKKKKCKFGKVKRGPRRGQCRKQRKSKKR